MSREGVIRSLTSMATGRVKMFSHNDLDGAACYIVANYFNENVSAEFCSYENVDQKIHDFCADGIDEYSLILISDISV